MGQNPQTVAATPLSWRLLLGASVLFVAGLAFVLRDRVIPQVLAGCGVVCFFGITATLSANLRAVNWRTIGFGIVLQVLLVLIVNVEIFGTRPGYAFFHAIAEAVKVFIGFTDAGATFVFGPLAHRGKMDGVFGKDEGFVFAFMGLPAIIFVSSFFSVLYYFGILQLIVRGMARVMMWLMHTSGAETLSATANVFLGQTEAPLIIKPYVEKMTDSELLAVMVGGMATISGGMMAVYIGMKADAVAILATSVMAAPCSLYLSKLLLPETQQPLTMGNSRIDVPTSHRNMIDAAAAGASDGMMLAINVAAMLIAFLAGLALIDYLLQMLPGGLSLGAIFGWLFSPLAVLLGVTGDDVPIVANLLGTKLVANEFVAFLELTKTYKDTISPRGFQLSTYALTGFANFGSIGIQLGGIGAMAPSRRGDLARLGGRALLVGFLATMMNAAIAGIIRVD